jgi:hypothetical protein
MAFVVRSGNSCVRIILIEPLQDETIMSYAPDLQAARFVVYLTHPYVPITEFEFEA